MGALKIGRVGMDIDLRHPQSVTWQSSPRGRMVTIEGYLRADDLADTRTLRSELIAQQGQLVPVVYDLDDGLTGVGVLEESSVEARHSDGALQGAGFLRFRCVLNWLGSFSEVEYQSLMSHVSAVEDHATTPSWWHAPPFGSQAYSAGTNQPTLITRSSSDGTLDFAFDVPAGTHPTWSVNPANYYGGSVDLVVGGHLRAGRDIPMDPAGWSIDGKTVRVRPGVTGLVSNGVIEVSAWQGSAWGAWVGFAVTWAGTNVVPAWNFVTCLQNKAEAVTVRLVRDALEANPTTAKHELDITVRRGARLVSMVYKFDGPAAAHEVGFSAVTGSTRPASASYIHSTALISGDRWLVGSPKAFTADTTNGSVQLNATSRHMPWWVGVVVADSAVAGQTAADLAEQYVGQSGEQVRAVRR